MLTHSLTSMNIVYCHTCRSTPTSLGGGNTILCTLTSRWEWECSVLSGHGAVRWWEKFSWHGQDWESWPWLGKTLAAPLRQQSANDLGARGNDDQSSSPLPQHIDSAKKSFFQLSSEHLRTWCHFVLQDLTFPEIVGESLMMGLHLMFCLFKTWNVFSFHHLSARKLLTVITIPTSWHFLRIQFFSYFQIYHLRWR